MSGKDRTALQKKIGTEQQKLQQMQAAFQDALVKAQNTALQGLLTKVKSIVDGIAQKGDFSLVITKSAVAYMGTNTTDITKQVINDHCVCVALVGMLAC